MLMIKVRARLCMHSDRQKLWTTVYANLPICAVLLKLSFLFFFLCCPNSNMIINSTKNWARCWIWVTVTQKSLFFRIFIFFSGALKLERIFVLLVLAFFWCVLISPSPQIVFSFLFIHYFSGLHDFFSISSLNFQNVCKRLSLSHADVFNAIQVGNFLWLLRWWFFVLLIFSFLPGFYCWLKLFYTSLEMSRGKNYMICSQIWFDFWRMIIKFGSEFQL